VTKTSRINLFNDLPYIGVKDIDLNIQKDCLPTCLTMVLEYLKDMLINSGFNYTGKIPYSLDLGFWKDFWKNFFKNKPEHSIMGTNLSAFVTEEIPLVLDKVNLKSEISYNYSTRQVKPWLKLTELIKKNIPPIVIVSPSFLYSGIDYSKESHSIVLIRRDGDVFYYYDPAKPTGVNYGTVSIDLLKQAHSARENFFLYLFPKRLYASPSISIEQATLDEASFKWKK